MTETYTITPSWPHATASTAFETLTNNTSIDTQSYLNVSTFSMTFDASPTAPLSIPLTMTPFYTPLESSFSFERPNGTTMTPTPFAPPTSQQASVSNVLGVSGARTSTLNSTAGQKNAGSSI